MTFRLFFRPSRYQKVAVELGPVSYTHTGANDSRVYLSNCDGQKLLDTMWEKGMRPTGYVAPSAATAPAKVIMIKGRPIGDYCTPEMMIGAARYGTALGYLAKHNPEAVELMGDLVEETKRDGWWLCHVARKEGASVLTVQAPAVLREAGVERVNAYPVEILKRRFGD